VVATDPDAGATLNYSITGGTGVGVFAINSSSGQITVANSAALDFETTPSFTLNVQVSDGLLNASAVITINLTDVNEAPDINNQTFIIDENLPNGSLVGTVTVTDPDAGDTHTFNITAGNTGNAFAINNSGNITVMTTSAVDFETTPVFILTVEVADAGLLTDIAIITINLNDLPDSGPIPNPILAWVTPIPFEDYIDAFGNPYTRYRMEVTNRAAYPPDMFAAAPGLPPCGLNTNSSRTWVHIYNAADNSYIYGFCALGTPNNLGLIWFARPQSMPAPPPSSVYIKLIDRQTMIEYTSNTITLP
jgi:hypothetical protein